MGVHPAAVIHPSVAIPAGSVIGPFALVDEGARLLGPVELGPGCHLYPASVVEAGVKIFDGAVIGGPPQDLKYRGESSEVRLGARTVVREYATVNAATAATGRTVVGADCLIMAYAHVAHDCQLGDGVIVANAVQMGGHVNIGAGSVVSGLTGIHQFTLIGEGCFVGGGLRVARDIPPFSKALGEPLAWGGVNERGLAKLGFSRSAVTLVKRAYRELRSGGENAMIEVLEEGEELGKIFARFFRERKRGFLR